MPAMADMTLWVRDNPITSAENSANDVKNTFSSWDSCMQKSYCKWPVIVAIIIASLILLSIISCLVRCLCCGLDCCCGCFKCFNACCECCTPRRNRRDKYRDEPPAFGAHNPYGGYQPPPAAPTYIIQQTPAPQPQRYEPSRQYASFDTSSKRNVAGSAAPSTVHEDALPSMPTWKDAHKYHEEEEVEMDHLSYNQAQKAPMLANQAPSPYNRGGPTPSVQTEGAGLYNDAPTHAAEGDLGDAYGHGAVAAGAGAGAGAMGGAAMAGIHPAYRQHTSPPPQQYGGYQSPQQHAGGYVSPPAHDPYNAPQTQGASASYFQNTTSPPPQYQTAPPSHAGYGANRVMSPVSPQSSAAGLPAALTPGGGIQPAHQAHAQDTGVTGGPQYNAYQGGNHGNQGWRDV